MPQDGPRSRGAQPNPNRRPAPGVGDVRSRLLSGHGSPEGKVYAGKGVLHQDVSPDGSGSVFKKTTASGNTGWVELGAGGGAVGNGVTRLLGPEHVTFPQGGYYTAGEIPWYGPSRNLIGPGDDSDDTRFYFNETGWWQATLKVHGRSSSSTGATAQPGLWCFANVHVHWGGFSGSENGSWEVEGRSAPHPDLTIYEFVLTTPIFYIAGTGDSSAGDEAPYITATTGIRTDGSYLGSPTGLTGDLTIDAYPEYQECRFDIRKLG